MSPAQSWRHLGAILFRSPAENRFPGWHAAANAAPPPASEAVGKAGLLHIAHRSHPLPEQRRSRLLVGNTAIAYIEETSAGDAVAVLKVRLALETQVRRDRIRVVIGGHQSALTSESMAVSTAMTIRQP